MIEFKNVTQGKNDCVLACMATILNRSLDEIHEVYPRFKKDNLPGLTLFDTYELLNRLGVEYISYMNTMLVWGRIYIVTVPSLNYTGGNHCIVIDCRRRDNTLIFDPAEGLIGKRWYTKENLKSWSEVIEILIPEELGLAGDTNVD